MDEAVIDGVVCRLVGRRLGVEFPRCRIERVSVCCKLTWLRLTRK